MKQINKKAISPVITTILLILIAIAAVAFVASVVIPFIKVQLVDKGECFTAIGQVNIDTSSKYTCWSTKDDGTNELLVSVSIKRGSESLGIEQFVITVFGQGSSQRFDIINDAVATNGKMFMFDGSKDGTISTESSHMLVPMVGELKTYVLNTTLKEVDSVNVVPIIEGNMCDEVDRKVIGDSRCNDADLFPPLGP